MNGVQSYGGGVFHLTPEAARKIQELLAEGAGMCERESHMQGWNLGAKVSEPARERGKEFLAAARVFGGL